MKPIIEITGLGKKYPIVHDKLPYSTLRDSIMNFIKHPFTSNKTRESFWALKDINLTINKGDIVGIIGKNGAGKSTLLKILSGITKPTEGKVKLYGRVSSLLEVGTGFHPELTGRENIYLNGVILGMTRKEVSKKFHEIVAFAGIEKFLDTPVKHYSSGMYVRLAFAVAAHLEPDILIVDEVLAVGDIEFQKKCLGKMESVSKEEGRTVIFVSHNMEAVQYLCNKSIILDKGFIKKIGKTKEIIDFYESDLINTDNPFIRTDYSNHNEAIINKISILDEKSIPNKQFKISDSITIRVEFTVKKPINNVVIAIYVNQGEKMIIHSTEADLDGVLKKYTPGSYKKDIVIPKNTLNVGTYNVEISIQEPMIRFIDKIRGPSFKIVPDQDPRTKIYGSNHFGIISTFLSYKNI